MTATEKRGFRLPWGAENRKAEDDEPQAGTPASGPAASGASGRSAAARTPATDLAPAIAPSGGTSVRGGSMLRRGQLDDLGRGPFDLPVSDDSGGSSDRTDSAVEIPEAPATMSTPTATAVAPEPDPDPVAEPDKVSEAELDVVAASAERVALTPKGGKADVAWPEMDRRGSAAHLASDVPPPPRRAPVLEGGSARRSNPLVAGLVKAMREAARAARDETTARMRADAAARVDEIRAQHAAAGLALKKSADADLGAIREWSRTEATRIRQETEARMAGRKAQLVEETRRHAAETEQFMADVKAAMAAFEGEMDRFFEVLLAEEDPGRLATLAERLPEPPSFGLPASVTGAASIAPSTSTRPSSASRRRATRRPAAAKAARPGARLAPDAAAAAEAEAIAGLDDDAGDETDAELDGPPPNHEPGDAPEAGAEPEAWFDGSPTVEDADASDPDPTHGADPVAAGSSVPSVDPDRDTNGHVAVELPGEEDQLAAWNQALAAIRARADEQDRPEPEGEPELGLEPASAAAALPEPEDGLLGVLATASRIDSPDDLSPEERIALLGFDEVPADADADEPAPEPVAEAPLEDITRVVVTGLASVAGISAFKRALTRVGGVFSVSVTTGANGSFVFSVVHATSADLRAAVPGFDRFAPALTTDDGSVLAYTVVEPAS